MKKNILIVGGTSGIGLELARHYTADGHTVCVTGRRPPELAEASFRTLSISGDPARLAADCDHLLAGLGTIHTLIYAAGFLQRGHIDALTDDDLGTMVNVGLLAPMLLIRRLKTRSDWPLKIILITSSSQYTPRALEPAYCAAKSGLGMLGASLVRDRGFGKVLVVAPSGTRTQFWRGTDETTETMLDPAWVAQKIVELSTGAFRYKYARILRDPARVDVVDCLDNGLAALAGF